MKIEKPRKNTGIVMAAIAYLGQKGATHITSDDVAGVIEQFNLDDAWDRDDDRKDGHGLKRSVADVIGGHQQLLGMESRGPYKGQYIIPDIGWRDLIESKFTATAAQLVLSEMRSTLTRFMVGSPR